MRDKGVRLLVVGGDHVPRAVVAALKSAPIEYVPVGESVGAVLRGRRDILLVAGKVDAEALREELAPAQSTSRIAYPPTIVVLGDPTTCALSNAADLEVTFVPTSTDSSTISRRVLQVITASLVKRGVIRHRSSSNAPSVRPVRSSHRPSRAPSRPSSRAVLRVPSFFQADLSSGASSTSPQALRIPQAPRLPSHDLEVSEPASTSNLPSVQPAAPRSLMPKAVVVEGSRWLVLDDDVARAHAVASAIEAVGGQVEVSGLRPSDARLQILRDLDASGVLVPESDMSGLVSLFRAFESDARLRWVPLVPIRWSAIFDEASGHVDREALKLQLLPHWQPDHDLLEQLRAGQTVDVARIGPAKVIRSAATNSGNIELEIQCDGELWVLGMQHGQLHSVQHNGQNCAPEERGPALDTVLNLSRGSACLLSTDPVVGARSFGPMTGILKAQASFGTPVLVQQAAAPTAFELWLAPVFGPVRRHWGRLSVVQRNAIAMGAGVLSTSFLAALLLNLDDGKATASVPVGAAPSVVTASVSGPALPTVAKPPTTGERVESETPQIQEPETTDEASAAEAEVSDPSGRGLPTGCGRWITAQVPVVPQPHQAMSAWRMARKAMQVGNLARAEELLCVSVAMDAIGPGPAGLVRFHFSQNNVSAATHWAEWAYQQKPKDPEVKQLLADVRNRQGKLDEARALLHDAMNVSAADVSVLRQVARKYANAGHEALRALDPGQAERLFRRAITLDSNNVTAVAGMAQVSLRKGELEVATRFAERAVKMNPRHFEVQLALGDVYAETNQQEKAKQAWLEAARMRPSDREARKRLGL